MKSNEYRAWDIRNSKMVYEALQTSETGQLVTVNAEYFNSPFSFFDGCKWMEFTGKKDSNGKKIFENDILDVDGLNGIVQWNDNRCGFGLFNASTGKWIKYDLVDAEKFEIIGNTYSK